MTDEARPYFPMFVDISHKKVVVVGAGTIAKR
ncbi:MAG: bifunctional precorrin-2 dehydrogenase/sirohydrochlorin ferrochelatase, partial [Lachnospiraceae bacterium]|nr:bifunctional precorrin-2 dehydrogenase/sirohydrochlorin ferrochelatase [Lachnospiraceae bacterium]